MEKSENLVVAVHPDCEAELVRELSQFAWDLQDRQHVERCGIAYRKPHWAGAGCLVPATVSRFVRLRFTRCLDLPGLARIRQLEAEYNCLGPRMSAYGRIVAALIAAALVISVCAAAAGGLGPAAGGLLLIGLGAVWTELRMHRLEQRALGIEDELVRLRRPRAGPVSARGGFAGSIQHHGRARPESDPVGEDALRQSGRGFTSRARAG